MLARFVRSRSTLLLAFLGFACRHDNLLGERAGVDAAVDSPVDAAVAARAICTGVTAGDVISDFESGTPALLPVEGRGGSWYLATDTGGPSGLTLEIVADPTAPHGMQVLRVHGTASNNRRYLQAHLAVSSPQSRYDISDCASFEIRARWNGGAASPVTLTIGDVHTVPDGGICGVGNGGTCHDDFGTTLALSSSWKDLVVPFNSLHQAGFGKQYPALMASEVYGPQFILPAGEDIDLYIDDITLH